MNKILITELESLLHEQNFYNFRGCMATGANIVSSFMGTCVTNKDPAWCKDIALEMAKRYKKKCLEYFPNG
jgi:hypothetical protein